MRGARGKEARVAGFCLRGYSRTHVADDCALDCFRTWRVGGLFEDLVSEDLLDYGSGANTAHGSKCLLWKNDFMA